MRNPPNSSGLIVCTLALAICSVASSLKAEPIVTTRTHLTGHTASYSGAAAAGAGWGLDVMGYVFADGEAIIGYLPASVGGIEIWTAALRLRVATPALDLPSDLMWTPLYVGHIQLAGLNRSLFMKLPERYPKGYYPPTALYTARSLGTEIRYGRVGVYCEVAQLDLYQRMRRKNPDEISLQETLTWGLGTRYYFE